MKVKLVEPDKPIFLVCACVDDDEEEQFLVQTDNQENAQQIVREYCKQNNILLCIIWDCVQYKLLMEDK